MKSDPPSTSKTTLVLNISVSLYLISYVSDDSFTYHAPPEIKLDDATEFAKNKQLVDADLNIHGDERW